MNAINLYITVPGHHTVTLSSEIPTGSQAQIIILTENATPTAQPLVFLQQLRERRAARPDLQSPADAHADIEAYIEACRNDWDD